MVRFCSGGPRWPTAPSSIAGAFPEASADWLDNELAPIVDAFEFTPAAP